MLKNAKAYILQPMGSTLFLIVAILGACIEIGIQRSHWYDVMAGFLLGCLQAAYQVLYSALHRIYNNLLVISYQRTITVICSRLLLVLAVHLIS